MEYGERADFDAFLKFDKIADSAPSIKLFSKNSPIGFALLDQSFNVISVNDAFATSISANHSTYIGISCSDLLPQIWQDWKPLCLQALSENTTANQEFSFLVKGNYLKTFLVSFYCVQFGNLKIGVGVSLNDISDRKNAEKALDQEMQRLSRLYLAIRQVNHAIVSSRNPDELFSKVSAALTPCSAMACRDPIKHLLKNLSPQVHYCKKCTNY